MNLVLLQPDDFATTDLAVLRDRRRDHILSVHRPAKGDQLRVGVVNGLTGSGQIVAMTADEIVLSVQLDQHPPQPLPLTLLLALPRPKMLKRVLQTVASLGVKDIYLINSYRVDKSFWGSALLSQDKLIEQMILGLEQARDTVLPQVQLRQRFKPFVEDELPEISAGSRAIVAHPGAAAICPAAETQPTTLAIGPEGGFIPYEIDKLRDCGFLPASLGKRILRVETAVPVLISRLCPFDLNRESAPPQP